MKGFPTAVALCLIGLSELAVAQITPITPVLPISHSGASASIDPADNASKVATCNRYRLQSDTTLNFKQRFCYYGEDLFSPGRAIEAAAMSGFAELRNSDKLKHHSSAEFPERIADYYARHAAKDTGEFLVGYLHHEDPRYHPSNQRGFVKRTGAAVLSVVASRNADGNVQMAFAPMAGALSSGMVSTVMGRRETGFEGGLQHAGFVYSTYFIKAVFNEYKPEFAGLTRWLLHRQ